MHSVIADQSYCFNDLPARCSRDFGVLYFVDQNPFYQKMMKMSIQSLKHFHPDWPVEVIECSSPPVPVWKKAYRTLSFWKSKKRYNRGYQDFRVLASKAAAWMKTPFNNTLFLDVDTIVIQTLTLMKERAMDADVLVCPLAWKEYEGIETWHPKTFPYLMSGVVFYNKTFLKKYKKHLDRMIYDIHKLPTGDQYIFSLTCELEASDLVIVQAPSLQLDVINMIHEFGTERIPMIRECLDLRCEDRLSSFHVFHYNEYKPQYMEQIKEVWGYPLDE